MIFDDLRPHLVLECPFGQNRIRELGKGKARVLCEEVRFGAKIHYICSRSCKKKKLES